MRGASALDRLLAEFPDARLRVQVVWEPVLPTDIAPPLTRVLGLLDDRRVAQYWDPERVISNDIVRAVNEDPSGYGLQEALPPDFIAWDVVAVFAKSARWEANLPAPAYYGGPVVDAVDATRKALASELAVAGAVPKTSSRETETSAVARAEGPLAPWEPLDASFEGCSNGSCGTRIPNARVSLQPGALAGQQVYCPVSGVVLQIQQSTPRRDLNGKPLYMCCEGCARYFDVNRDRVLAVRGLRPVS